MTNGQKFRAWLGVILSYILSYGAALYSSYYYLAKDKVESNAGKGGAFFYFIVGVVLITFTISVTKLINKMKANIFKSLFKGLMRIGLILFTGMFVKYIASNFDLLYKVLSFTTLGMILGLVTETFVVYKYKDYIQEVGIL